MDFPALGKFCRGQKRLARDLAGNAFSTTVCTAVVIGSLCHLRLADDMQPVVSLSNGSPVSGKPEEMPACKAPRLSGKPVEMREGEQGMRPAGLTDGFIGSCETGQRAIMMKNGVRMRRRKFHGYSGMCTRLSPGNCEKQATSFRSRGRGRSLQCGVSSLVARGPKLARLRRFARDAGVFRRGKKRAQQFLVDEKGT